MSILYRNVIDNSTTHILQDPSSFNTSNTRIAHELMFSLVVTHFWVPTKQKKMKMRKYKKIYQKIFERNPKNNMSEKRMLKC